MCKIASKIYSCTSLVKVSPLQLITLLGNLLSTARLVCLSSETARKGFQVLATCNEKSAKEAFYKVEATCNLKIAE